MTDLEGRLFHLAEVTRKDSGVDSSVVALEQLSLLLLARCYHKACVGLRGHFYEGLAFEEIFSYEGLGVVAKERPKHAYLNDSLENAIKYGFSQCWDIDNKSNEINSALALQDKLEEFTRGIPFKLRSDKILHYLLRELSAVEVGEALGKAYTRLVAKTAKESISFGAHVTPQVLVDAIVEVVSPNIKETVYDPALGVGSFLLVSSNYVGAGGNGKSLRLFGDGNLDLSGLVCTLNLLLNGVDITCMSISDMLSERRSGKYDVIFSHLPVGKVSLREKYEDRLPGGGRI